MKRMEEEAAEKRANGLATDKDDATVASWKLTELF